MYKRQDQDYDIDVWPTSCPWFSEIVANHSSITVQGLLKKERWNGTTAKDMEENFLYYVRSDIYGDVYSGLCLNNWLLSLIHIWFYLAIQFDSTEIATNLRKRGGMIPGVRPGKPTADYLNRAIKGMADSGSLALVLVSCLPMLLSKAFGISLQLGGTSLLIVVGVAIELAGQVDSQLTIRHHDGFLD